MEIDLQRARWINRPEQHLVGSESVEIVTEPGTDFWEGSYYGFRNSNAPALLFDWDRNFSFTARAGFAYRKRFDQCGLFLYVDRENWFKVSVEFENESLSRLGSVVTNAGYSDWSTVDIPTPNSFWYRLSRRGPDFLAESSETGENFRQMRVFHLHSLGETTLEMGRKDPPDPPTKPVRSGLYACSPGDSRFKAVFSDFRLEDSRWRAHAAD